MDHNQPGEIHDPYKREFGYFKDPPKGVWSTLGYVGPGLVLTASVIGSGELIATTGLGAKTGFIALWLILVSCVIKIALQLMVGRFAIYSGDTTLVFFDKLPGFRFRASWFTWLVFLMLIMVILQQGAMIGGLALVLNIVVPAVGVEIWALVVTLITIFLLRGGGYRLIEHLSLAMVLSFSVTTLICVSLIQSTPFQYSVSDLLDGLKFELPPGGAAIAFAVFGITGVGTTEILYYPYWCIEKGYARSVGKFTPDDSWYRRARGWIRTMNWDAFIAFVIYTTITIAFYILGAAVLYRQGLMPVGMEMISVLSQMYTDVLGMGAFYLFLFGAFFALFSTVFVSVAANARLFADCFQLTGLATIKDYNHRKRIIKRLVTLLPVLMLVLFLLIKLPFWMVILGGTTQTLVLPFIVFGALFLRYRKLDKKLLPSKFMDALLLFSCLAVLIFTAYGLISQFM